MNDETLQKRRASWLEWSAQAVKETKFPDRPIAKKNEEGRLSCETGPALATPMTVQWFLDGRAHGPKIDRYGTCLFFFKGVLVPTKFMLRPEELTFDDVMSDINAEVRYVGMELYGFERCVQEGHMKVIDTYKDDQNDYTLLQLRKEIENFEFKVVRVLNGTPNLDGTYKPYFLIVPPDQSNAREAVAWTFYRTAGTYAPSVQT